MRQLLIIPFYLSILNCGWAQSHPYSLKFSHEIESYLASGKINPTRAGTLYSLIGEYERSITMSEVQVSWGVDSIDMKGLVFVDALGPILKKAKNHKIVIISENHLKPQHRIFAKRIIKALSSLGFRHLGMETLSNADNSNTLLDTALMQRGYPLNSPLTGTYTLEPRMGNLVRESIKKGYHLFAYERSKRITGKDRDEIQADNIIRYLEAHPGEKVVLLCGFHHAIESPLPKRKNVKWMAHILKERTGIDPLTIYQDNFTEKSMENEHPFLKDFSAKRPAVALDKNNEPVLFSAQVDIEVFHPKTNYINGRPHWLYEDETYKSIKIQVPDNFSFPILAKVYHENENDKAVPIDIVELKHKYLRKELVLPPGNYNIVLENVDYTHAYSITVE